MTVLRASALAWMLLAATASAQGQWEHLGGPAQAPVDGMLASPRWLYVTSGMGGLNRTSDNGHTWQRVTFPVSMSAWRIHQCDGQLFCTGSSLLRSSDDGTSWHVCDSGRGNILTMDAHGGVLMACAGERGLSTSSDSGRTWRHADAPGRGHAYDIHVEGSTLLLAGDSLVYRSSDDGRTWHPTAATVRAGVLHEAGRWLYVGGARGEIWRTSDLGRNWQRRTFNMLNAPVNTLSHLGESIIAATDGGLYMQLPGDTTWQYVRTPWSCHRPRFHTVANGRIHLGNIAGLFVSDDGGATWMDLTPPLYPTLIHAILVEGDRIQIGAQSGLFRQEHRSAAWTRNTDEGLHCLDVYGIVFDMGDYVALGRRALVRSTDDGATWTPLLDDASAFNCFALERDTIIVSSAEGLRTSTDRGAHWEKRSTPIQPHLPFATIVHHRGAWFAGAHSTGPLIRSRDAGATWQACPVGRWSSPLLAADHERIITYGRYDGLSVSTDIGDTWLSIPTPAVTTQIISLVLHNRSIILMSADSIYIQSPGDAAWRADALPVDDATELNVAHGFLYMGTRYTGLWRCRLSDLVGVAPAGTRAPSHPIIHGIAPHPVGDRLTADIEIQNSDVVDVDVWDALGRHVAGMRQWVGAGTRHRVSLALPRTPSGIHLLRIRTAHGAATRAFLVR